ncbi:MAG: peptidoglycan-binding protein, partial [Clostridia bacterium]|nr:peptidoglycan-binding protein [Clostridia bacterium]
QDYLRRFIQGYQEMEPLKGGDINNQVQAVQRRLLEAGYFNGIADGVFGDATRMAVERFQMVNGLPVTGVADGMTLMRLMADVPITWQGYLSEMSCAAGDAGLNVYVLQKKLDEMGYFDGDCTGSFGDLTQGAVAAFQSDNGLEATGVADAALWELIYSGTAVARRRADVTQLGDSGDSVSQIQQRLNELGYFYGEADGDFDYDTETAVRLFQMGNELSATGRVGGDTLSALLSDTARAMGDPAAQERFAALLSRRDADVQARIAEIAGGLVGKEFSVRDDALYPGFALVQYVCVAAGLPITAPETVIRLADDPVEDPDEVQVGNILAFQTAGSDNVTMLLTVGAGEGRIIYATPEVGWVVMSYLSQIDSESVYRWAEPEA